LFGSVATFDFVFAKKWPMGLHRTLVLKTGGVGKFSEGKKIRPKKGKKNEQSTWVTVANRGRGRPAKKPPRKKEKKKEKSRAPLKNTWINVVKAKGGGRFDRPEGSFENGPGLCWLFPEREFTARCREKKKKTKESEQSGSVCKHGGGPPANEIGERPGGRSRKQKKEEYSKKKKEKSCRGRPDAKECHPGTGEGEHGGPLLQGGPYSGGRVQRRHVAETTMGKREGFLVGTAGGRRWGGGGRPGRGEVHDGQERQIFKERSQTRAVD